MLKFYLNFPNFIVVIIHVCFDMIILSVCYDVFFSGDKQIGFVAYFSRQKIGTVNKVQIQPQNLRCP